MLTEILLTMKNKGLAAGMNNSQKYDYILGYDIYIYIYIYLICSIRRLFFTSDTIDG